MSLKILFIGGTGVISSECSASAIEKGYELYLLNRGATAEIPPSGAIHLKCDIKNYDRATELLKNISFDSVVDWIAYSPEDVKRDFELFRDKTEQYVFISTASAYRRPPAKLPVTEDEPLMNPVWEYSQKKIRCEQFLFEKFYRDAFPVTVIRPSHTYNKTKIPLHGGFTALNRLLTGKPVIIHGDGTSLWTLTHSKDFARGFVPILGNDKSIGQAYHITSDETLTWNLICDILANALNVQPDITHVPSDIIYKFDKEWGEGLLGDKAFSMIFDNSKIKKINPEFSASIPFSEGAAEIIDYYLADTARQTINPAKDKLMDKLAALMP